MEVEVAQSKRDRLAPVAGLAAHLGRGVQRLATDAALGRSRAFPRRVADLDATALSRITGRAVTSVTILDGSVGTSSRSRLALTGEDAPASVFVKMSAGAASTRMLGEIANLGENEVRFYNHLSSELSGVPRSYGSVFDRLTGRFVIVLEDMTQDSCEFFDTLRPIDRAGASQLVEMLAHVHGTFWNRLPLKGTTAPLSWLTATSDERNAPIRPPIMRLSARRIEERTAILLEDGRFVVENCAAAVRLVDVGPHTVLHGDGHPGNVFFRNGKAGLLDWQVVKRGHPARDLAYSLIIGMTTDERRASQRELLDIYRAALASAGGPELDREELWDRYRQAAVSPFLASLATAGLGGMQSDDIVFEGLQRSVNALSDLETVALLQKSL
jgi:aminoglycoside phosphotransferase (APT) family kinase protein